MTTLWTMAEQSKAHYPDNVALIEGTRQYSFKEFVQRTRCMGNALLKMGLQKGDRVAILDRNSIECAESYFSIPNAGLVLVMLNPRLAAPEILDVLSDAQVSALILSPAFFDNVSPILNRLDFIKHFILIGDKRIPQGWHEYEDLIQSTCPDRMPLELNKEDLAALMYTSGTTGKPKGCMVTHNNFYHAGQTMSGEMDMTVEDRGIIATPMFHASGMVSLMNGIYSGTPTVIMPRWDTLEFLRLVERYHITTGVLATPMMLYLTQTSEVNCPDISSLRKVLFAGAPVTPAVFHKAIKRFGNLFIHGFGTTETTGSICILRRQDIIAALNEGETRILSSCGKACTDMTVQVVDGQDQVCSVGCSGEIRVRGVGVTRGYWKKADATRDVFRNGWFYTGDLGRVDEKGFVYIVGRKKDVIITGAENVFPAELENVLNTHTDIQQAVVIGLDDAKWGEIVTAFVVPQKGVKLASDDVIAFCRKKVAGYKVPKKVFFIDALPLTPTGKLMRNKLKEQFNNEHMRNSTFGTDSMTMCGRQTG